MQDQLTPTVQADTLISVEQQRAIQEVQAQMIIAKRFPRDVNEVILRILKACERKSLAGVARYSYPRGGTEITGPAIRIMEVIGQNYGNLNFGIAELSQEGGASEIEAFAWDLETNVRMSKTFRIPHTRKAHGKIETLVDPRDIYEHTASQGARRMRACLMAVIPRDIIEAALEQCDKTLESGDKPLEDRIREMLAAFDKMQITKQMIEQYLDTPAKNISGHQVNHLIGIHNSIRDGIAKREAYFNVPRVKTETVSDLNGELEGAETEKTKAPETEKTKAPETKFEGHQPDSDVTTKAPSGSGVPDRTSTGQFKPSKAPTSKDPTTVKNWFGLRVGDKAKGTGLESYVLTHLEAFKGCSKTRLEALATKWRALKLPLPLPWIELDKQSDDKQKDEQPPHSANGEATGDDPDDRYVIWSQIRKAFTIVEIEAGQNAMGLGIGVNNAPSTAEGCRALQDHLTEKKYG